MERAVELGINLFDTAEVYGHGHSEEVVGQATEAVGRERVLIATKVGGDHLRPKDVARACRGSLRRLRVEAIDLYQVHWPSPWDLIPLRDTMKALEKLQREGKIRHIGVSNFAVRDLEEARAHLSRTDIVSNQVQYSLLHREPEAELLRYCRREGIGILAWSPIAKGILAGKYDSARRPKDAVRSDDFLFKPENLQAAAPLLRLVKKIGRAHGKTPAQVSLAWLRAHPGVVPIPGVKRAAQAEEHAEAAGLKLTSAEVRALDRISGAVNARLDTF
jgi:aryl-alcohol dehydrogenase-like predicted oxidoreductase